MSYEAVPEENAAPRWRKYAAMGAVALTAFAGVSAYSQYGAAAQKSSDGSPARKIISSLARSIQSKAMGDDDVIAPGVSCTEMSEVFNRCIDYESSFGSTYTCGDVADLAMNFACNETNTLATGVEEYMIELYEEIGICKELTKAMGSCFIESGHWGTYCEDAKGDIVTGEAEDLGCTMTWYGERSDDVPLFPGESTDDKSDDDASTEAAPLVDNNDYEGTPEEYAYYDSLPAPPTGEATKAAKSLRGH